MASDIWVVDRAGYKRDDSISRETSTRIMLSTLRVSDSVNTLDFRDAPITCR
jgi:hypothetical protein